MILDYLVILWQMILESAPYLLIGLFIAGLLRAFLPQEFLARHLGNNSLGSAFKAALFGIPLPLCCCGVLPTAVSLYRQGASLSATFAFLVATPQTSVDAILLAYGLLGSIFAIAYPVSALFGAFLTSLAMVIFIKSTSKVLSPVFSCAMCNEETPHTHPFGEKVTFALQYAVTELFAEIAKPLLIGFLAAALVALILPPNLAESLSTHGLTYPAMLVIGLPLYVCATASIPLGYAFLLKGFSPGSVLIFLMAGPGTNLTSLNVLSKIFGKKVTGIYLVALSLAALLSGIILDSLVGEILPKSLTPKQETLGFLHLLAALILLLLFLYHFTRKRLLGKKNHGPICGCGCGG